MIMDQSPTVETLKKQLDETQRKHKRVAHELSSMINAQGNLYRFQERIEQQKVIYSQIAAVGHHFNEKLEFNEILTAIDRFVLNLLNYERYLLFLPDPNNPTLLLRRSHGGFLDMAVEEEVKKITLTASLPQFKTFLEGSTRITCDETSSDAGLEEFRKLFRMQEFLIYNLGKTENSLKGVLIVGNTKENANLHQRISAAGKGDDEMDALFSNITSQISGALNTMKFMQAIQFESAQVKRLLNNMRQAVFSVKQDGTIVEPVSKFADSLFGSSIVSTKIYDTIFKDLPKNTEIYTALTTGFSTVFGESELQWDLMDGTFPVRVIYMHPTNEKDPERILKINYRPIWDDNELLEKIMFVVEDITELERLEKQIAKERGEIQIIQELARNNLENISNFFTRSAELLEMCKENTRSIESDPNALGVLMRNLHTLKGNARLFGYSFISKRVHTTESIVLEIKGKILDKSLPIPDGRLKIFQELYEVQEQLQEYAQVANRILNIKNQFEPPIIQELNQLFIETEGKDTKSPEVASRILTQIWIAKSLRDPALTAACDKLSKTITPEVLNELKGAFLNLFSRSMSFKPYSLEPDAQIRALSEAYLVHLAIEKYRAKKSDETKKDLGHAIRMLQSTCLEVGFKYLTVLATQMTKAFETSADAALIPTLSRGMTYVWRYLNFTGCLYANEIVKSDVKQKVQDALKTPFKDATDALKQLTALGELRSPWFLFLRKQTASQQSVASVLQVIQTAAGSDLPHTSPINEAAVDLQPLRNAVIAFGKDGAFAQVITQIEATSKAVAAGLKSHLTPEEGLPETIPLQIKYLDLLQIIDPYLAKGQGGMTGDAPKFLEIVDVNLARLERAIVQLNTASDQQAVNAIKKDFRNLLNIPVKPMLFKFQTMVKEVSTTLGKKVQYDVTGADITLSREQIGNLQDALVHVIRNGIDHGIEIPEERVKQGKKELGLIEVQCIEAADHVALVITDDGRGIDPKRIADIALKKGIITEKEHQSLSDKEKVFLIFKPGFSSKEQASELSGRGVGMEIVETLVKKAGGELALVSRVGLGSEFTIKIKN